MIKEFRIFNAYSWEIRGIVYFSIFANNETNFWRIQYIIISNVLTRKNELILLNYFSKIFQSINRVISQTKT